MLDACALLRVAQAAPGMDVVVERLGAAQWGECRLLLHEINLGEVEQRIGKVHGWTVAERKRGEIGLLPIEVVTFSDTLFWDAVRLKAAQPISYADAFAAALAIAIAHGATLLTADPEFETLGDRVKRVPVQARGFARIEEGNPSPDCAAQSRQTGARHSASRTL